MMNESAVPELSPIEARVLGVLAEKQRTVPDTYPLTLNALVSGCNQKSSRDPIMNASLAEVRTAIDSLIRQELASEISGARADKFAHHIERALKIPSQSVALITTLLLRGPQTAGELRLNSERLHRFADISSVESFLEELSERNGGALVVKLPRQPGSRENRWMHLLSGVPEVQPAARFETGRNQHDLADTLPTHTDSVSAEDFTALQSRVAHLEAEIVELKVQIAALFAQRN